METRRTGAGETDGGDADVVTVGKQVGQRARRGVRRQFDGGGSTRAGDDTVRFACVDDQHDGRGDLPFVVDRRERAAFGVVSPVDPIRGIVGAVLPVEWKVSLTGPIGRQLTDSSGPDLLERRASASSRQASELSPSTAGSVVTTAPAPRPRTLTWGGSNSYSPRRATTAYSRTIRSPGSSVPLLAAIRR